MKPMSNRLPVGPGSRGGHWHELEFRSAYFIAWRAAHPEYRDTDKRRRLLDRAIARLAKVIQEGDDDD